VDEAPLRVMPRQREGQRRAAAAGADDEQADVLADEFVHQQFGPEAVVLRKVSHHATVYPPFAKKCAPELQLPFPQDGSILLHPAFLFANTLRAKQILSSMIAAWSETGLESSMRA